MPGRGPQHSGECGARAENRLRFEEARAAPSCCHARRIRQECRASLMLNHTYAIMCRASLVGAPTRLCSIRLLPSGDNHHLACFRNGSWLGPPRQLLPDTDKGTAAEPPPKTDEELPGAISRTQARIAGVRGVSPLRRLQPSRVHGLDSAPQCPVLRNSTAEGHLH